MQPLVAGPRSHLTEVEVAETLAFTAGGQVRWGVDLIEPDTGDVLAGVDPDFVSGEVRWSYRVSDTLTGGVPGRATVRRTGALSYAHHPADPIGQFNPLSVHYRPYMEIVAQSGEWVRWHLGVLVCSMPPWSDDGMAITRPLDLADKTHLYQTSELTEPVTVPAGTNIPQWVRDDLQLTFKESDVTGVVGSKVSVDTLTFEPGQSRLDVYNLLLEHIGSDPLHADDNGRPISVAAVDPESRAAEWVYEPGGTTTVEGQIVSVNPTLPNTVRFVARRGPSLAEEGNGIRTVVNSADGPGSLQARGGQPVTLRVEVDAADQPALDRLARSYAQHYFAGGGLRWTGQVAVNPSHSDSDVIRLVKPRLGVDGLWLVTGWTIRLGGFSSGEDFLMGLEAEMVTGAAFVSDLPPTVGAYGTDTRYGVLTFGGAL